MVISITEYTVKFHVKFRHWRHSKLLTDNYFSGS
ncbi:hypothetical protein ES674_08530 [Bizionia myxarmorum]|uniref:Uncharacterized protein n=1 Tax=Bizionia myxarmorum TaxID=291186 RepID=A0A5D0RF36_9FLAO|nr:hypothetical protein ES674_08530 [Bizionia myxarmorum]